MNAFATPEEQRRFETFCTFLISRGRRASTLKAYQGDWQALSLYFRQRHKQSFNLLLLSPEDIQSWRARGRARGRSAATINRRLAFLKSYLSWLEMGGVIEAQGAAALREAVGQRARTPPPRILSDVELHRLLRHIEARACPRDQALFRVLLDTGIRVGEMVSLNVEDLEPLDGALMLQERLLPILSQPTLQILILSLAERGLMETLPERLSSPLPLSPRTEPLFVGERGRLTENAVQRIIRKHSSFARIRATPQVLRHTFASRYWLKTEDLVGLAEILGHESLESTRIYTRAAS